MFLALVACLTIVGVSTAQQCPCSPSPQALCNQYFDVFGTGKKEYRLAFRGTKEIGLPVFDAYTMGAGVPSNPEPGCLQITTDLPCSSHYRNNDVLDNWQDLEEVVLALYKDGVLKQQITFDALGTNFMDFYTAAKVKNSTYTDLKTATQNIFSIQGYANERVQRRFYINHYHGGCPNDEGWLVATDYASSTEGCDWEIVPNYPVFRYAVGTTYQHWTNGNIDLADVMAIFVKYL